MVRATYIETRCKSALNRVAGMPFNWSLNPYRGCVHSCHYCYARATHSYFGMNADEDFESKILVKTNMPEVLRAELARSSWRGEQIAVGTATDAYQPAEGKYQITRGVLQGLRDAGNSCSVVTKSTLIVRDLNLLVDLARQAPVRIYFTITTLDPQLWRLIEPGTPPPHQRLAALRRLSAAGIPCGVLVSPILPGLTDSASSIDAVARAAAEHGATTFGAGVLRLAPLVKEHYFGFIAAAFPDLLGRYDRAYTTGASAPRAYQAAIEERLTQIRTRHGFGRDPMRSAVNETTTRFPPNLASSRPEQLPLAI
jgi:DNA repair photolyase